MSAITYTFSEQHRPFPTSGNALTEDGSPLHSRLGIDTMLSINNLAYSMPFAGFALSYDTYNSNPPGITASNSCSTTNETFCGQLPTVIPQGAGRFCWTLGMYVSNTTDVTPGTNIATLDSATVYLSPQPYSDVMCVPDVTNGMIPSLYRAFDTTKLGTPYGTSTGTCGVSLTNGAAQIYTLIDNSAGTAPPFLPFLSLTDGGLAKVNLVVTTTAHRTSGSDTSVITIVVEDFSWWILPE